MSTLYDEIYQQVRQIPPGRVATYGTIARLMHLRGGGRVVGFALRALPHGTDVPWHRVINARGTISLRGRDPLETNVQHELLASEGVAFDAEGVIDLARFGWHGP